MVQVDKTSVLLGVAMALFVWPTQSMAQASGPAWCDVFPVPYPFKGVVGKGSLNSNAEILNLKDCYAVRNGRLVSCNTVINLPKTEACWVATYNDELRTRIPSNALSDSRAGGRVFFYCGDIFLPRSSMYNGLPKDILIQKGVVSYGASRMKMLVDERKHDPLPIAGLQANEKAHLACNFQTPNQARSSGIAKEYDNPWKFVVVQCTLKRCKIEH